eukprot:EG_transcript_16587
MGCRSSKVVIFPCSPDLESTTTTVALRWETARRATTQFDGMPCPPAPPVHIITHPLSALPWAVSQGDSSSCSSGYNTEEEDAFSAEGSVGAVAPDSPVVAATKAAQKCVPRSFPCFSGPSFPDTRHHLPRCATA